MNALSYYFTLLSILLFASCTTNDTTLKGKSIGYYYWKTEKMNDTLIQYLQKKEAAYLFVKVMDIGWNNDQQKPVPLTRVGPEHLENHLASDIIPAIYITNATFVHLDTLLVDSLAAQTSRYLSSIQKGDNNFREIQIDCDWTSKTKDRYFAYLTALKKHYPTIMNVTLRLYPYKYPKIMGVPPADKATLMCYNLGDIKKIDTENSILATNTLESYMVNTPYPLSLDIALPIFGWHVWFYNNNYQTIIYDQEWEKIQPFTKQEKDNIFVLQDEVQTTNGFYRAGSIFRNEYPSTETLQTSLSRIQQYIPNFNRILFFHLTEENISKYETYLSH